MTSLLKFYLDFMKGVCQGADPGFLFTQPFQAGAPQLHQWRPRLAAALTPNHWELLCFLLLLFFDVILFHPSFLLLFYFCLSPHWLEWVSCRLCCVVFDSSLGARLSLAQLRGPTVFLKSVSINIIIACSRHHWIFYCNVQQNVTPTQRKCYRLTETSFWLKGLCEVCFICGSFCVSVVLSFCAVGKVRGLRLIKWLGVFFFLSGIYYWHFPGIGWGALHVDVQCLFLSSLENHLVQPCRPSSLVRPPACVWLWLASACVFRKSCSSNSYLFVMLQSTWKTFEHVLPPEFHLLPPAWPWPPPLTHMAEDRRANTTIVLTTTSQ